MNARDGTGFPNKLKGNSVPILARIVAVADIFDFLSSERGHALPLHEVEKAFRITWVDTLTPNWSNSLRIFCAKAKILRIWAKYP